MSILRFSDGVQVDTSGPIRPFEMQDGWYVIGAGYLIPVDSEEVAVETANKLMPPESC